MNDIVDFGMDGAEKSCNLEHNALVPTLIHWLES
jgi:hypothetical protein